MTDDNESPSDQEQTERIKATLEAFGTTLEKMNTMADRVIEGGDPDQSVAISGAISNLSGIGALITVTSVQLEAINRLNESSQKLENLTKSIRRFTWGLLALTTLLVVTSIVTIVMIAES